MTNYIDTIISFCGLGSLLAFSPTDLTAWVTVICSALIALVTCFVQVYRLWRDKDKDSTDTDKTESQDETDNTSEG